MSVTTLRQFVPADLQVADWSQLEGYYRQLAERPLESLADLEKWLTDFSELSSVVDEYGARRYIAKSCYTEDTQIEADYMHYVEAIEPQVKPWFFQLQQKYAQCPFRSELPPDRFAVHDRRWGADVEIFRPDNVPLQTAETKLASEYDKLCGAMTVFFDGAERTLPQLQRYLEENDRHVRQSAWEGMQSRRAQDGDAIEDIFDQLLEIRRKIAQQTDLPNYRDYIWKQSKRFDYTPDDCLAFGNAVATTIVPLLKELHAKRKADLKVEALRPWDLSVDPQGRPPLRPFAPEQTNELVAKCGTIFQRISPVLANEFARLQPGRHLDLESRKGKQPGGYQASLEEVREPFIFMNAAGMQQDVITLLHEAGHAFHYFASADEPLVFLRTPPMEFCEVASMSMELLASPHFDVFYDPAEAVRAQHNLLERTVTLLPWIAIVDGFQQALYTQPNLTRAARTEIWLGLAERFGGSVDWSGYESIRARDWQRQLHLFHLPFYYIEYGIAQLGALQLWQQSWHDPRAIERYRRGLSLGGKRSLPELFAAAGLKFDFSVATLAPLAEMLRERLLK